MHLYATGLLVTMMLASASPGAGMEARPQIAPDPVTGETPHTYDQDTVVSRMSRD
jgi:hypothetical protein